MAISARTIGEILNVYSANWTGARPAIVTKITSNTVCDMTVFLAPGDVVSEANAQVRIANVGVYVKTGGSGTIYAEEIFNEVA